MRDLEDPSDGFFSQIFLHLPTCSNLCEIISRFFPKCFNIFQAIFSQHFPIPPGDELLQRPPAAQREARHAAPGPVLPGRRRRHGGAGGRAALRAAAAGGAGGWWESTVVMLVNAG